ncbi:thiamine pyrophosphate-binding protein [Mycobacterium sp. 852002-51057_SCH5723018]|uniref:thiamine pyrophosphate-binding protein n=1 Tax=Mycobacterium sp. 852002-51057_SCH5723018 TaxID=1834094 RepID=UPI0008009E01|nr:thiamine pyrophosphate-binding protein [Mycobacterium sp. 852002-51057_SCH5723018]OBG30223.1 glyoxylate carboligase [Mycobacterium sp. 852002-51057_SCH5723018]
MHVYEAIVKGLESIGVDTAFGGNGENIASLTVALKHSRIRAIATRHEQAAAYMACGYAMFTNKLGVCYATVGPGAFNLLTGLGVAMSDSYPVLAITGFIRTEWQGRGAVNDTSGVNGTPDSRAIFAAATKESFFIEGVEDTCDILEEAVNTAFSGRPGPVHIHVPQNLTDRGVRVTNYRDIRLNVRPVQPEPNEVADIAAVLADTLRSGRRAVLLAGYGAIRSGAQDVVLRFIERFQLPLITTLDGKGIVAESHPLCAGVFHESGHSSAWKAFREAEVVLAVGNSLSQHATFGLRKDLFEDKTLVQVNIAAGEIGKFYPAQHALVSDARLGLEAIMALLETKVGDVAPVRIDSQDYEFRKLLPRVGAVHPGKLAQSIGRHLPPNAALLADAGTHLAWMGYYVDLKAGQNFRKCGQFGPMAAHTNGAIGVKLAQPERTVVVGCGDGCYSMAGFELMTALQHDVAVIWVIFNDDEYKLVKVYQLAQYQESALVEFRNPDFAAYARACGADGHSVDSLDDFERVFTAAIASGRPTVIDVKISRWALPHYSTSPDGVLASVFDQIEQRLRGD